MKAQIEYGLEGAFKLDLYSGGKFVETSDWFSNFITQTGLMYPTIYPFVDCFRFLSLGSGTVVNYGGAGGHNATTGLQTPISTYTTNVGTQRGTYIGWQGYETGGASQESACGTSLTEAGPRFFRAWTIPTGEVGITINEPNGFLNIQEFMVSPSSGTDTTGNLAFSRIVRNLSIPNGFRAIVSYQLRINVKNTGTTQFIPGTFQTGNADITNDAELISGWAGLSGYYRQVFHGLECIDKNGAAYISKYGAGMEPSLLSLNQFSFYLSPDNSQFDVNGELGGPEVSETVAYASDGLMSHIKGIPMTLDRDIASFDSTQLNQLYYGPADTITNFPDVDTPRNIRLGGAGQAIDAPSLKNYSIKNDFDVSDFNYQVFQDASAETISYATPGVRGFDTSKADFGEKAVFSTRILKLPILMTGQNLPTGRKKTVSRKTLFSPVSSLGYNTRFGSLVFAYSVDAQSTAGNKVYYPMMDCLFYDSSGRSLMQHYRMIDTIALTERGTGIATAYMFLTPLGENAARFTPRKTFQGPYNFAYDSGIDTTHPCLTNALPSGKGGLVFSGQLKSSNIEGDVNVSIDNGSGWGAVYGVVSDGNFWELPYDAGLANHSLSARTPPNPTDTIYWPSIKAGNEIVLNFSGIEFFQPEVGLISNNTQVDFFSKSQQIIETISFGDRNNSCGGAGILAMVPNPTGFKNGSPISGSEFGYFLSTTRYDYYTMQGGEEASFVTTSDIPSLTKVSGVILGAGNGTASCSTVTTTPTKALIFNVRTGSASVPSDGFTSLTNAVTVTGFFSSVAQRGYASGVSGIPIKADEVLAFALTGRFAGNPLYLTYVWLSGASRNCAHSYLNPLVQTSHFAKPTGYLHHVESIGAEGYRLLPLHGLPNNSRIYTYAPKQGGSYPALSFDNGLELYFDISWSSPCGGASECNEPL